VSPQRVSIRLEVILKFPSGPGVQASMRTSLPRSPQDPQQGPLLFSLFYAPSPSLLFSPSNRRDLDTTSQDRPFSRSGPFLLSPAFRPASRSYRSSIAPLSCISCSSRRVPPRPVFLFLVQSRSFGARTRKFNRRASNNGSDPIDVSRTNPVFPFFLGDPYSFFSGPTPFPLILAAGPHTPD